MLRYLPIVFVSVLFLSIACPVIAEEANASSGSIVTQNGSGRTLTDILASIGRIIPDRPSLTLKKMAVAQKTADAWENESAFVRKRQAEHRRTCAEAIRRANRDAVVSVASQCMRSELLQEINLLRKEQQYIEAIPLTDNTLREAALLRLSELMNAQSAIIDAIDAGLFAQIDGLKEAKRKLHVQYRLPLRLSVTRLRLDRERSWIALVRERVIELQKDTDPQTLTNLHTGVLCMESAAQGISSGLSALDAASAAASWSDTASLLSICRKSLRMASQYQK